MRPRGSKVDTTAYVKINYKKQEKGLLLKLPHWEHIWDTKNLDRWTCCMNKRLLLLRVRQKWWWLPLRTHLSATSLSLLSRKMQLDTKNLAATYCYAAHVSENLTSSRSKSNSCKLTIKYSHKYFVLSSSGIRSSHFCRKRLIKSSHVRKALVQLLGAFVTQDNKYLLKWQIKEKKPNLG